MAEQSLDFAVVAKEAVWVALTRRASGGSLSDDEWLAVDPLRRLAGQLGGEAGREWQKVAGSGKSPYECARHVLRSSATRHGEFMAHQAFLGAALAARLMELTGETAEEVIDNASCISA